MLVCHQPPATSTLLYPHHAITAHFPCTTKMTGAATMMNDLNDSTLLSLMINIPPSSSSSPTTANTTSYPPAKRGGMRTTEHLRSHRPRRQSKVVLLVRRSPNNSLETIPEYPRARPRALHVLIVSLLGSALLIVGSRQEWMKLPLSATAAAITAASVNDVSHRQLVELKPEHLEQYPFNSFWDTTEPTPRSQKHVTGFFWHVPRAGGTTLKHVLGKCLPLVLAERSAEDYCDMSSNTLSICKTEAGRFVNVDPSDHHGIQRAERMGLIPSEMSDVVVSSRLLHAATLFDEEHKGRFFTILRHPIERSVSMFYYLQGATWERTYRPEYKDMTLLEYAALPDTSSNWMVRWLTGKNSDPFLSRDDLEFAKLLIQRKFLVLLTNDLLNSVKRLMYHMDWSMVDDKNDKLFRSTKKCIAENTAMAHNKGKHPMPDKNSPEYKALAALNEYDIELYEFVEQLYAEQSYIVKANPKRTIDRLFRHDDEEEEY